MPYRTEAERGAIVAMVILSLFSHTIALKQRGRTSILTSWMYIQELLTGHSGRFKEVARMQLPTFSAICQDLWKVGLADTLAISVEEQLG